MRKNHTLTYNETTYTIEDVIELSDILINGKKSDWYLRYYPEGVLPGTAHIRLNNHFNKDKNSFYKNRYPTQLQFNDVVDIIKFIRDHGDSITERLTTQLL